MNQKVVKITVEIEQDTVINIFILNNWLPLRALCKLKRGFQDDLKLFKTKQALIKDQYISYLNLHLINTFFLFFLDLEHF